MWKNEEFWKRGLILWNFEDFGKIKKNKEFCGENVENENF
jgi:hypothetical protein